MKVVIYVEGGGDSNATLTFCKRGFSEFFKKLLSNKASPRVIPCGGRHQAFDDFRRALENPEEDEQILLLVDSEAPVPPGVGPWAHLKSHDQWDKPEGSNDDQAHLMVQCMESWFVADGGDALAIHYKRGFKKSKLPKLSSGNVELISKEKIEAALKAATKDTKAEKYHKIRDGFKLLELIDPEKVCSASKHADRLRNTLMELLPDMP